MKKLRRNPPGKLFQCPRCGAKTKHHSNILLARLLVVFFSVLLLITCVYLCFFTSTRSFGAAKDAVNQSAKQSSGRSDGEAAPAAGTAITLEQFGAVETGMTADEMFAILGGEGTVLSESTVGEGEYRITTVMYQYNGVGVHGANANFMIQNGKVVSKTQFGLK